MGRARARLDRVRATARCVVLCGHCDVRTAVLTAGRPAADLRRSAHRGGGCGADGFGVHHRTGRRRDPVVHARRPDWTRQGHLALGHHRHRCRTARAFRAHLPVAPCGPLRRRSGRRRRACHRGRVPDGGDRPQARRTGRRNVRRGNHHRWAHGSVGVQSGGRGPWMAHGRLHGRGALRRGRAQPSSRSRRGRAGSCRRVGRDTPKAASGTA